MSETILNKTPTKSADLGEETLKAMEARCEAAAAGPWEVNTNRHRETSGEQWGWIEGPSNNWNWSDRWPKERANAEFVAHAREDLPRLLTAYRELKSENERLENEIGAKNERLKAAAYDLGRAVGFMSATRDRIDEYVKTFPEVPTPAPPEKEEV